MKGLILDLRGNPGGNLSTVCDIARMILPKGLIVYTEDKYGKREEYTCKGENAINVPLVVLTDGFSASASEILAGAVKDYQIGTLVGTTTFGKGIVQKVINLSDGSAVKLTVSSYFTPNGNNIHGIGIEPDPATPARSVMIMTPAKLIFPRAAITPESGMITPAGNPGRFIYSSRTMTKIAIAPYWVK